MTHRDWIDDFVQRAHAAGDEARLRLTRLGGQAYDHRETDPDRARALYEEGSRLAEVLGEPWWKLHYDNWRVTAMLCFQRDYREVLGLAVQNVLELRKPLYLHFPSRFSVQRNLISCYIGIDADGYATEIEEALAHLEAEVPETDDARYLVLGSRREFYLDTGRLDLAVEAGMQGLRWAAADPHPSAGEQSAVFVYSTLCVVAGLRRDWTSLDDWSREGERLARRKDLQLELCEFLVWEAVVARQRGDEERGRYLFRRALTRLGRLKMPPDSHFHEGVCAYHELAGDLVQALQVREQELERIAGRGQLDYECRVRIQIAALLQRLGQSCDAALAGARVALKPLRAPGRLLRAIEAIERGEPPGVL
jgi:hypothetical protein